ncbi:ABC transporter permease [Cytobacillus sp. IB215665]|uniref:ABC transporter permease n=1 Tax=Cytobacillus sp. IB215665 TaxID=3097357 RepID=UPI002A16227B|nr:ABC transporter permease [Cytobacillus sp. IB215665]MDX8365373.1 ABC transporter permease [Cytobacillus sp. IB215665]
MSINQLILRNLRKNLKNYYLYVFALIFSVALYYSFVTLQYDPSMDPVKGSIKGAASIRTASILLVAIVAIFLLYANNLFIKRRSMEIGLFQLIGMTKKRVFSILTIENFILYFSSLIIGIFIGFSVSKLIVMILFKTTKVETIATLHFSSEAFIQTLIIFSIIYLFIMFMNFLFINRQNLIALFHLTSKSESKVKKLSIFEGISGILGMILIVVGYYFSSILFSGSFSSMNQLFLAMLGILTSVIIGTYLLYKGSVSFISHIIRKKKDGYLNINEVLSLSTIMFRMKSNALLLTVITTVSALAIGLLSLSYISYYSAEKSARNSVAADFAFTNVQDAKQFTQGLKSQNINFLERKVDVIQAHANLEDILDVNIKEINTDPSLTTVAVIGDHTLEEIDLNPNEILLAGYEDAKQTMMPINNSGVIELMGQNIVLKQKYIGINRNDFYISSYFTFGGLAVAIVDEITFNKLTIDLNPDIQKDSSIYIGIDIINNEKILTANDIYQTFDSENAHSSSLQMSNSHKRNIGLLMFIVGFLGLTFLITSGCILYFKQLDESEEEKGNYTILRKLGFTQGDLLKGIQVKQMYNFGIPLIFGLLHSYFAVQSGWFWFGTELWTPMIIVMILYTVLYSIFGILSVRFYKKVIKEAL